MKLPSLKILLLFLLTTGSRVSFAQTCEGYFPVIKGAVMESTSYSDKGKKQSVQKVTIKDVEKNGDEFIIRVLSDIKDEKDKLISQGEYEAHCEKGVFFINMKSMISAEQMKAWRDMNVSIQADDMEYPVDFAPGQKLADAHLSVNVSMNDMNMPGFFIDITERVVEGKETITTPAGTFECMKVSSKQKIKNIVSYEMRAIEWLAKGKGVVRVETYKGEKMKGYTELTSLK
jgi:hypothetical protein